MSATSQLQLSKPGDPFTVGAVPITSPGPNEVSIRVKAIALNNLDVKQQKLGLMIQKWPAVLGLEVAGIIEAVGRLVTTFEPGDEVCALAGLNNGQGAFQEVITVPSVNVARKPNSMSFAQAATFPVAFLTAACSTVIGLNIPILSVGSQDAVRPKSVLILGGSTVVAGMTIQMLRLFAPEILILTTASPQHHSRLLELGADKCFIRDAAQQTPDLIKEATSGRQGVDAILDTVAVLATQTNAWTTLRSDGPRIYAQVSTGTMIEIPADIDARLIIAAKVQAVENGAQIMAVLESLLASKKIRVPVHVDVVGKGLSSLIPALERLAKGVSGEKLVVEM